MTLTSMDLAGLRPSLALFFVLTAIGVGAVFSTLHFVGTQAEAHRLALAQHSDIDARLARVAREGADIRRKIALYRELMAKGESGGEYRALWLQRIAQIKLRRRIVALRYELSPRRPLDAAVLPGENAAGGYEFMASTMKLQMQLLHEDDLLGFLADIGDGVRALLRVRGCDVTRHDSGLNAECTLDWITLRKQS